ncbi:MAG: hypothetical protein ACI8RZ_001221 [Myxococcota bacterium]|jgi:hypothetical protein
MTTLLVGHALADGTPLGPTLRELGASEAAREAEAGQLDGSLRRLGFSEELQVMARLWPAALQPARVRLSALPTALIFQLPMAQTLGYLALIGLLQGFSLLLLFEKILPQLQELGVENGAELRALTMAPAGLLLLAAGISAGLLLSARHRAGWRGHYDRARQAALAAGMAEAGAPLAVRQTLDETLTALDSAGANVPELDQVTTQSLALAEQAHRREVAVVRLVGIGGLMLIGLAVLSSIYRTLSAISVPL